MTLPALLQHASARVHGADFNAASWAQGGRMEAEYGRAVSIELVASVGQTLEGFGRDALWRVVDHLRSKQLPDRGGPGVTIWIWFGDHAHGFDGTALFDALDSLGVGASVPGWVEEGRGGTGRIALPAAPRKGE